jgi:type VI secretion system protein ImpH
VGPENRREDAPVIRQLLRHGRLFSFCQAVHLLEPGDDSAPRVGEVGPAGQERVLFRSHATLGFPASDVESVEARPGPEPGKSRFLVTVNLLGLYGPASPLPASYTEEILSDDPDESTSRAFLDLFDHRFVSLLYRCWRKYRYYIEFEPGGKDRFSCCLFALIGLLHPSTREEGRLEWVRLIPFAGLLGMRARSAFTLRNMLCSYFGGIPVRIEEAVLERIPIEEYQWNRIGRVNSTVGVDCMLGSRVPDLAGKFRIHLGPLDWTTFTGFLPVGELRPVLGELVSFVVSDCLGYDITLHLSRDEVPPLELSTKSPCRLGWSTWLGAVRDGEAAVTLRGR